MGLLAKAHFDGGKDLSANKRTAHANENLLQTGDLATIERILFSNPTLLGTLDHAANGGGAIAGGYDPIVAWKPPIAELYKTNRARFQKAATAGEMAMGRLEPGETPLNPYMTHDQYGPTGYQPAPFADRFGNTTTPPPAPLPKQPEQIYFDEGDHGRSSVTRPAVLAYNRSQGLSLPYEPSLADEYGNPFLDGP